MTSTPQDSPRFTPYEEHLRSALESVVRIAKPNEPYHTGFRHIRRIAQTWLEVTPESARRGES